MQRPFVQENDRHREIISEMLRDVERAFDANTGFICPSCPRTLQKYGKKVRSNSVILQRFVCPDCKRSGRKHNYFIDSNMMGGF